jgi:hypothetical protein
MHAMPLAQPAAAASHDLQNHPTLASIHTTYIARACAWGEKSPVPITAHNASKCTLIIHAVHARAPTLHDDIKQAKTRQGKGKDRATIESSN